MKKSILFILLLCGLVKLLNSQTKSIAFESGNFEEIKSKALKQNKLIFIYLFSNRNNNVTAMDAFNNAEVAKVYNNQFINVKMDLASSQGEDIANIYEVKCDSYVLFLDGNGNVVHRFLDNFIRSLNPRVMIELAKEAILPQTQFSYFTRNYNSYKNNEKFLLQYINAKLDVCMNADELAKEYFLTQKDEDLTKKENWDMYPLLLVSIDSREFMYIVNNKEKFLKNYSEFSLNKLIENVCTTTLENISVAKPFNQTLYNATKTKMQNFITPQIQDIISEYDLMLEEKNND